MFVVLSVLMALFCVCANAQSYNVYVGSIQVTDENAFDVLGDNDEGATVTYDPATKTLTLDNAHLTDYALYSYNANVAVYSMDELNVVLVGDNSVTVMPDEEKLQSFAIAFMVEGNNISMTSFEEATIDINVGTAKRENFGFYITGGNATFSGKVKLDIELSDILIREISSVVQYTFGNSIGIHAEGSICFRDDVSVNCKTGNIFVPENSGFVGTLDDINSGGTTVGGAAFGELVFDTTGEMYFYIGDGDGKRAGITSFNNFEIKNGSVVIEMAPSKGEYLIAGPVVYLSMDDSYPCVPLCGASEDSLVAGEITDISFAGFPLKTYANADGSLPVYSMLVPAVVGIPEVSLDSLGNTSVSVTVEDEEKTQDALVVFSAYNVNGKMTDVKFALGTAAQDGKISTELDVSDAVRVVVFVFENTSSMKPLAHQLEITDLT